MKRLLPILLFFAALPAMAVTPRIQHTCVAMGRFAGQVQKARQAGLSAASVQKQANAGHGSPAEHRLWRDIIRTIYYQIPVQATSAQVNRSFYGNCMAQMQRKSR